jgi:hypothetical protein
MELSKAVRFGYYDALNGNVTSSGNDVPIFDVYAVPEDINKPYILLSTQTSNQLTIKRCKRYNATILIDIVTGGLNSMAGRIQAEDISEQIEGIINPDTFADLDISAYGYQLANTERENDTDASSTNGSEYIYRKLIRYNHLIVKL